MKKGIDKSLSICYNKYIKRRGENLIKNPLFRELKNVISKFLKKFHKPLDKQIQKCYNKDNKEKPPLKKQKGIDTMVEKMTYAKALKTILNGGVMTAEVEEKLNALLASIEKKNSAEKKPTAQQKANAEIVNAIYEGMAENRLYTITEIIKEIPACADLTNQRVSAIIRGELDNLFKRVEDKRKAYFTKIVG